jgi:hypothetical protein
MLSILILTMLRLKKYAHPFSQLSFFCVGGGRQRRTVGEGPIYIEHIKITEPLYQYHLLYNFAGVFIILHHSQKKK